MRKPFYDDSRVMVVLYSEGWGKTPWTNHSTRGIDTSTNIIDDRTGIDPNFIFDVRNAGGEAVPKRVYEHPEIVTGHVIFDRIIKPGDSLQEGADISRLYDMNRPGKYSIRVSRYVLGSKKDGVVKSNLITVTIAP